VRVTVVTPDKSYFDGDARSVTLQAVDGEMGILPRHAPLIARLGHGVARVDAVEGGAKQIAVYGGFVKVQDDVVNVLAGGASTGEGQTADAASKALSEAKSRLEQLKQSTDPATASEIPEAEEAVRRGATLQKLLASK
jgi:F-type H+-transporting ATPase subunit epsilon